MFILLLCNPVSLSAQKNIRQANKLYSAKKYCEAIPFYDKHLKEFVDKNALIKRGNCHFHCNNLDNAISDFENAIILGYIKSDVDYFMARALQQQHKFESAIDYYKKYLASSRRDKRLRSRIVDEIKRCANGLNIQYLTPGYFIENMGDILNSKADELNIIQSPNIPDKYYFSVEKMQSENWKSSIYYTLFEEGNWAGPYFMNDFHSKYNEKIIDFSENGMKLYFSRWDQTDEKTKLMVDYYSVNTKALSNYKQFEGPVYYEKGDRDLFLINDSTFIFSSDRAGGFGGYDLYITGYRNGYWLIPKNLGNQINSTFDELSPFMTKNGDKLYFSSNSLRSIGGFDIFWSSYTQKENGWLNPVNVGIPINSANDELHFIINSDGTAGFLSSNRKMENFGGFDLFRVFFENQILDQLDNGDELAFMQDYSFGKAFRHKEVSPYPPVYDEIDSGNDKITEIPSAEDSLITEKESRKINKNFEKELIELVENQIDTEAKKDTGINERINIKPFYYSLENPIFDNELNLQNIKSIASLLQVHPALTVQFTAHCTPGESKQGDILKTIKILESISSYLINKGFRAGRIRLLGAGSSFPVARVQVSEKLFATSQKFNDRIDVSFYNIPDDIDLRVEKPFVIQHLRDNKWPLYESLLKGLSYNIQLAESGEFQPGLLNSKLEDCFVEKHIKQSSYSYFSGIYKTYNDAETALEMVESIGYTAVIIPHVDGRPLKKTELLNAAKEYLDLINYLEKNMN